MDLVSPSSRRPAMHAGFLVATAVLKRSQVFMTNNIKTCYLHQVKYLELNLCL